MTHLSGVLHKIMVTSSVLCVVNYLLFGQDDVEGARMVLRRPRGVNHITRVGVDKVGFNRLLVPYQHPLLSLSSHLTMPAIPSSYIVPFDPLGNPLGTILTAAQRYNRGFKHIKQGSATAPYPDPATIYRRSVLSDPEDDMFEDIYMGDM